MAFADAGCVLKVDWRCEQCKYKLVEVLSSVIGVYNVDVDGDSGLVRIAGEVDPNRLIKAVARTGAHAEVVRASFKHPSWNPHSSTSLGYNQLPLDYGQYHSAAGMIGGGGGGNQYYPYGMGGGGGGHYPYSQPDLVEEYPFRRTAMHGGHRFPSRLRPPMGGSYSYPPPGYGGMYGSGGNCFSHM